MEALQRVGLRPRGESADTFSNGSSKVLYKVFVGFLRCKNIRMLELRSELVGVLGVSCLVCMCHTSGLVGSQGFKSIVAVSETHGGTTNKLITWIHSLCPLSCAMRAPFIILVLGESVFAN